MEDILRKLIVFFLLLIVSISYAQTSNTSSVNKYNKNTNYGIKLGINLANIHGKNVNDTKTKFGIIGGIYYDYSIQGNFSIQPEVLFSMKGFRVEDQNWNIEGQETFNYIDIPVLVKYKYEYSSSFQPILYFGPCFSFHLFSTYHVENNNITYSGDRKDMKSFELSIAPGLILKLNNKLDVDCRFTLGLTEVNAIKSKNSVLSIILGYSL